MISGSIPFIYSHHMPNVSHREQQEAWEESKKDALGATAKMGPTTSPIKRSKEQEDEEENMAPKGKKRRKKLKYKQIGAGWGLEDQSQGAHSMIVESPLGARSPMIREQSLIQPRITSLLESSQATRKIGGGYPCNKAFLFHLIFRESCLSL